MASSSSADHATPRREFLGQIAASAIVMAGTACTRPLTAAQSGDPAPAPTPARSPAPAVPVHWDDSWFARLSAKHKAVFDSPMIEDGAVLSHATGYIRGMRDAVHAGPDDVQAVVVIRHAAVPMVFNDAMWAKYEIGKERKVKDERSNSWAVRNPFAAPEHVIAKSAGNGAVVTQAGANPTADRPQPNLEWLASHGHIILACDLATRGYASIIAGRTKTDSRAIYDELKENLVPGTILQPTGVYAALRAQEAGCAYFRST